MLPAPGFHHLHLNSLDPAAAIDFYTRQFASTSKSSWGGLPALQSPNNVLLLFSKVAAAPATAPQSAIWHFGWHVTDVRKSLKPTSRPEVAPPALTRTKGLGPGSNSCRPTGGTSLAGLDGVIVEFLNIRHGNIMPRDMHQDSAAEQSRADCEQRIGLRPSARQQRPWQCKAASAQAVDKSKAAHEHSTQANNKSQQQK